MIHGGDAVAELKLNPGFAGSGFARVIHGGDAVAELKLEVQRHQHTRGIV